MCGDCVCDRFNSNNVKNPKKRGMHLNNICTMKGVENLQREKGGIIFPEEDKEAETENGAGNLM